MHTLRLVPTHGVQWFALLGALLGSGCARPAPAICPEGPFQHEIAYPEPLTALAVDRSSTRLGVGSPGGNVALIDLAGQTFEVLGNLGYIRAVEFSPDGKVFAAAGDVGVRVWDLETRQPLFDLEHDFRHAQSLVFSPTERLLATCTGGDTHTWSMATGERLTSVPATCPVAFMPDGLLVTSAGDGTMDTWFSDGTLESHEFLPDDFLRSVAFSRDGKRMALATEGLEDDDGGTVELFEFDPATGLESIFPNGLWSPRRKINVDASEVAFSDDGERLIMAGPGHFATIWSATRRAKLAVFAHETAVWQAELSFSGARLATLDLDGTITSWDVGSSELVSRSKHELEYAVFAWSTTDDRLFSAASGGGVNVECR